MDLFVSKYTNKIDKKGRVSLPSSFRNVLPKASRNEIILYKSINVIDATFGGGGYSKTILEKFNVNQFLAIDRDPISKIFAKELESKFSNFILINDKFSNIEEIVNNTKFKDKKFDIIIFVVLTLFVMIFFLLKDVFLNLQYFLNLV